MGIVGTMKGRMAAVATAHSTLAAAIAAAVLAAGALTAQPLQAQTTLRAVMHSDLKIVDPIFTTAYITRNHGYMIYDTLFSTDAQRRGQAADGGQVHRLRRQAEMDLHAA